MSSKKDAAAMIEPLLRGKHGNYYVTTQDQYCQAALPITPCLSSYVSVWTPLTEHPKLNLSTFTYFY